MANYGSWTLPRLKEELRQRKARISGRKHELIERLEAYDRNKDFGSQDEVGEEYLMKIPDSSLYKDFNSETDFIDSPAKNLHIFLKTERRAQRTITITYGADISIGKKGSIEECHIGMGPSAHCKHEFLLDLLALHNYFSDSGEIITEETCTQRLQTFHHSKPHKDSPIKANSLPLSSKKASDVQFDPRPRKYRNSASYNAGSLFTEMDRNVPKWTEMNRNGPKWSRNGPKWSRNGPKWRNNGRKWRHN